MVGSRVVKGLVEAGVVARKRAVQLELLEVINVGGFVTEAAR